jgi:asparagine synthase (glutamine-hydrolysing)
MLYVDARFSLADNLLMYGDKMSMASSLEARVPFLDLEFMRLAEAIPSKWKLRGRERKYILKRAVEAWLPGSIIHRKKLGFAEPVDLWFQGKLRDFVRDTLLSPDSICTQLFRPQIIAALLAEHATRKRDHTRQIFSLLSFALWHRRYLDGEHSL